MLVILKSTSKNKVSITPIIYVEVLLNKNYLAHIYILVWRPDFKLVCLLSILKGATNYIKIWKNYINSLKHVFCMLFFAYFYFLCLFF